MNAKLDISDPKLDSVKWLAAMLLVSVGLVGFYYFSEVSTLLRVVLLLGLIGSATFLIYNTEKGRALLNFTREANIEVRKVVWPTRQETVQMTGIILLMVLIVAIFIWILDSTLLWLVKLLTGQGG